MSDSEDYGLRVTWMLTTLIPGMALVVLAVVHVSQYGAPDYISGRLCDVVQWSFFLFTLLGMFDFAVFFIARMNNASRSWQACFLWKIVFDVCFWIAAGNIDAPVLITAT